MLNGIRIFTTDDTWRKILIDLGATVVDCPGVTDIRFDKLGIKSPALALDIKSAILDTINHNHQKIINRVFGKNVILPRLQMQIVTLLVETGGMTASDLRSVLGYSPDVATHTIDTAIYQLRKTYGRDFIKNDNGKYIIGKL